MNTPSVKEILETSAEGEIIKDHPLASSAGVFADDPLWDEFIQAMEDSRREIDAANPVNE